MFIFSIKFHVGTWMKKRSIHSIPERYDEEVNPLRKIDMLDICKEPWEEWAESAPGDKRK